MYRGVKTDQNGMVSLINNRCTCRERAQERNLLFSERVSWVVEHALTRAFHVDYGGTYDRASALAFLDMASKDYDVVKQAEAIASLVEIDDFVDLMKALVVVD